MDNKVYWVWLTNLAGIFPNKITALLEHFDSVEDIYKASTSDFQGIPGISRGDALILNSKDLTHAGEIIKKTEELGAGIITYDEQDYPDSLRTIPSPPYVLYIKGEILKWDRLLCIGVVGTRRCTEYGIKATHQIGFELAKCGVTLVSGMARGIDTVAARAALDAGNKTIAVLGSGIDVVYPAENDKLMEEIIKNGAVITEYPPGSSPLKAHFPERNRIISGLSKGILVVEAPEKSGALITARCAIDTGKDVFAVPGSIFSYNSLGSNKFLKEAGKITTCAQDILDEYPDEVKRLEPIENKDENVNNVVSLSIDDEKYSNLNDDEKLIIKLLIEKNMPIDELQQRSSIDIGKLNSILPLLEMMGFIRKLPGDSYKLEC